ncbi:gamma-aminobutyric acid receptor alpha-like [Nilaparvata lugens]|uniref:gamma-aminobutyric acid receptor alpha-like n=1 Tax=Nilaparvata lugens TaxID=108931 RepID=UPI00193DB1E4|nr:gamma-aminobutyric acid receptor alpha-like [Nilaparvata lugens]
MADDQRFSFSQPNQSQRASCPADSSVASARTPEKRFMLTIKAGCPMNLENFPMDTQRCPLKFGSFGYTIKDVTYVWRRQVVTSTDMKLSQFDLIGTPAANQTDLLKSGK